MITKKQTISVLAVALLAAFTGAAHAADSPATFEPAKCRADYPRASLMNEEQGTVSMSFLVNPDGSVAESKLEKSSGFKNLDRAAMKSISACKFKPGTKDGAPAKTWTKVDYAWRLD